MKMFSVMLDEAEIDQLKKLSKEKHVSMSAIIRIVIDNYIEEEKDDN